MSSPSIKILPDVGLISPFKCETSVDFPEPVWPIIPRILPLSRVKEISLIAAREDFSDDPYIWVKFSTVKNDN